MSKTQVIRGCASCSETHLFPAGIQENSHPPPPHSYPLHPKIGRNIKGAGGSVYFKMPGNV